MLSRDEVTKLVNANQGLVYMLARRYNRNDSLDDLAAEGNLGLVEAAYRFDPQRGVKFGTYAAWWIKAFILRYNQRNQGPVNFVRNTEERTVWQNLGRACGQLAAMGPENAEKAYSNDPDAIAKQLKVTRKTVERMMPRLNPRDISLDFQTNGDPVHDRIPDGKAGPEDEVIRKSDISLVRGSLGGLNDRERRIITMYYVDDIRCMATIGRKIGISRERVRQIRNGALRKLGRVICSKTGQTPPARSFDKAAYDAARWAKRRKDPAEVEKNRKAALKSQRTKKARLKSGTGSDLARDSNHAV